MSVLSAVFYWIAWWLFRPLNAAIRYRVMPETTRDKLVLDPNRPVVYVLGTRSWGDLFILDRICRDQGLPVPRRTGTSFPAADRPGVLYLPALLETRIRQTELSGVVEGAAADPAFDAQVVPVSVYWGRDPGQETSLWKLLFADSVQAGAIRKLFIMLVNSRNVYITGMVAKPGPYPLRTRLTVLQLIAMAGGVLEFSSPGRIAIMRQGRTVSNTPAHRM